MAEPILLSPTLIGVFAGFGFFVVRKICLSFLFPVPAPAADTEIETAPLLPVSHAAATKNLSPMAPFLCAVGAFAYICLTSLAMFQAFLEHGQRASNDPRFAIFRGGELSYAFIVLILTTFDASYSEGQAMRTDALYLVLLPMITALIRAPSSSRLAFVALDWVVTPMIGTAIFAASVRA
ncbi:hypothetical protein MVEN_02314600 [Mycena venus]|uniref:Uncharacterized protein n=1 Tax=Mycena venus TaxID=2733690 RepID=A0A8H7CDZ1_9AGAR|nr:hypothetical protein MVEN_02314600 [Mycena venus]